MPDKKDRCVRDIITTETEKFNKKYGKSPSVKRQKEIEESAWRICNKVIKEV